MKRYGILATAVIALWTLGAPSAFADTAYRYYSTHWAGAYLNLVATSTSDINGTNVSCYHLCEVGRIDTLDDSFDPAHIEATSVYSVDAPPDGFNLNTVLIGKPSGDYIMAWPSGMIYGETGYCFLTWNGSTADTSNCGTAPASTTANVTRIDVVSPADGSTIASDTPYSLYAGGSIAIEDILTGTDINKDQLDIRFIVEPLTNSCISVICFFESASRPTFQAREGILIFSTTSPYYFAISTSSPILTPGTYKMTTRIDRPTVLFGFTSILGVPIGHSTLTGTTTLFIVGTSTTVDRVLMGLRSQGLTSTTTEAALNSCLPVPGYFNVSDCVVVLFVPQTQPDYGASFAVLQNKVPFGYFSIAQTELGGVTTTQASTTVFGMGTVAGWLTPLINGLAYVLWFLLIVWIFHRIRKWDFQS